MANAFFGLTDIVKFNDANARDVGASDLLDKAQFLKVLHATTASNGTQHSYLKQTGAPVVAFRVENTGKDNSVSSYAKIDIVLKLLDASFFVDIAVAKAYRHGPERFIAMEAENALQEAFYKYEKQIWYGTGADANGFAGLGDNAAYNGLSDPLVVNAGGTTAATGSSAWLVRTTPDERNMTAVMGNEGTIAIGETATSVKCDDTTPAKSYGVYYTPIEAYVGLQIGSAYSAVRIANLTADSGKGMTDALVAQGLSLFPAGEWPTHLVMNRRSLMQLQKSRTATNSTGAPAPFPTESFGIPIVVTDSIVSTEALVA